MLIAFAMNDLECNVQTTTFALPFRGAGVLDVRKE